MLLSSEPLVERNGRSVEVASAPAPRDRRIRIGYVVPPSPSFAGIERAVHTIANAFAQEHSDTFEVHVISGSRHRELEVEDVHYRLHHLGASRLRQVFGRLRAQLNRQAYDVLIVAQCEMAALTHVAARMSRLNRDVGLITYFHGNPSIEESKSAINRALFAFYRASVAPRVMATFAVSDALAQHLGSGSLAGGRPVYHVPNPVRSFAATDTLRADGDAPSFISVGRLSRQKGHDILLRAFVDVLLSCPDASLDIVGGGEDEAELKALAARLGLGGHVRFHGQVSDPSGLMRRASVFALASRWEGFPLALLEAQSLGLPLVAADCPTGPAEIVDRPWVGRLAPVEDASAFARAMLDALTIPRDGAEDDRRRARAARYAPSAIGQFHADLIQGAVAKRWPADARGAVAAHAPRES